MGEFRSTCELWCQAVLVRSSGICMVVLVHCIIKFLSANFVETKQHGNHILFCLRLIFVRGVSVLNLCTEPLTVCFEFSDSNYFVLIFCGTQHLSIHEFPDGSAE